MMRTASICLLIVMCAQAQDRSRDTTTKRGIVLGVHLITTPSPSAADYFLSYQKTLGGSMSAFTALNGICGSVMIDLSPVFSVVLQAQSLSLSMDDVGNYVVTNSTTGTIDTSAHSSNHWAAQTYPFLVGVRYTPVPSRFQSFVTLLGGFAINQLIWNEQMYATSDPQRFVSAYFQASSVVPTFAIGTGFELLFDQFDSHEVLRGISLEARYRWMSTTMNVFGPLASASQRPDPEWRQSYAMNFSGIELLLGVQLQFYK